MAAEPIGSMPRLNEISSFLASDFSMAASRASAATAWSSRLDTSILAKLSSTPSSTESMSEAAMASSPTRSQMEVTPRSRSVRIALRVKATSGSSCRARTSQESMTPVRMVVPRVNGGTPGAPRSSGASWRVYMGSILTPSTVVGCRRAMPFSRLSCLPSGRPRLRTLSTSLCHCSWVGAGKSPARVSVSGMSTLAGVETLSGSVILFRLLLRFG